MTVLRAIAKRWLPLATLLLLAVGLWILWGYAQNGRYQLHKTEANGWWLLDTRTGKMRRPEIEGYRKPSQKQPDSGLLVDPEQFQKQQEMK